jgi:hypothetical protein
MVVVQAAKAEDFEQNAKYKSAACSSHNWNSIFDKVAY